MSARIEDVLAEHQARFHYRGPQTKTTCSADECNNWEAAGDNAVAHRSHVADILRAGVIAEVLKTGFNDGYASARRFYERAKDSPAPATPGDGGARPEAGGEASSPGVGGASARERAKAFLDSLPEFDGTPEEAVAAAYADAVRAAGEEWDRSALECEDCGRFVRHSACGHGKDMCPGCWPGLCHGCQADSAGLCGDATKAGDVL